MTRPTRTLCLLGLLVLGVVSAGVVVDPEVQPVEEAAPQTTDSITGNTGNASRPAAVASPMSFLSVVPIDQMTTEAPIERKLVVTNTTESPPSELNPTQKPHPHPRIVQDETTIVVDDSIALNRSAAAVGDAASKNSTQSRDTTTLFIAGNMLNEDGVPLEASNSTEPPMTTTVRPVVVTADSLDLKTNNATESSSAVPEIQNRIQQVVSPPSNASIAVVSTPAAPTSVPSTTTTTPAPVIQMTTTSSAPALVSTLGSVATTASPPTPAPNPVTPKPEQQVPAPTPVSTTPYPVNQPLPTTTPRPPPPGKTRNAGSNQNSKPTAQLFEIQPGIHLLESHPDSPLKILRLSRLFGNPNRSIELTLTPLADTQWRRDFFQLSHYLITNTDRLGFFKVSLEQIFSQHVHGQTVNYHSLISNHTNLYVSATLNEELLDQSFEGDTNRGSSSNASSAVLLISRLGDYIEIYGLLNEQLMITPLWRHSTTVFDPVVWGTRHGSVKRGEQVNQFYTDPRRAALLHAVIDMNGDSIDRHMGFNVRKLLQQIKIHISLNTKTTRGESVHFNVPPPLPHPPPPPISPSISPEVSLIIDHLAYQNHGQNVDELWRYMVIYFTRLDLIFRQLNSPTIRLRLKDIFIATKPFVFQKRQPILKFPRPDEASNRTYLNALKAINELGVYLFKERATFANADLVLAITGADLCLDSADSGWVEASTSDPMSAYDSCSQTTVRGQSFVGGACRAAEYRQKKLNVAIVEDSGYFDGILVAAHEIGHQIGAVHDGQMPIHGILGPGGRGCASTKGYLMSDTGGKGFVPSYNQFRWSLCTAEQFAYFARLPAAMCLYDRPPFMAGP